MYLYLYFHFYLYSYAPWDAVDSIHQNTAFYRLAQLAANFPKLHMLCFSRKCRKTVFNLPATKKTLIAEFLASRYFLILLGTSGYFWTLLGTCEYFWVL